MPDNVRASALAALQHLSNHYYHMVMDDGDTVGDHLDIIEQVLVGPSFKKLHDLDRLPIGRHPEWYVGWHRALEAAEAALWSCDWQPDDLNPGPDCPYCAGDMCARFDGLGCGHNRIERHGYGAIV